LPAELEAVRDKDVLSSTIDGAFQSLKNELITG
jgi:hypothetical protein